MFSPHQIKALVIRKYFFLFLCLISALVLYPFTFQNTLALSIMHTLLILSVLTIAYLIQHHSILFKIDVILGLTLIGLSTFVLLYPTPSAYFMRSFLLLTFYIVNISIFLTDITHKDRVTSDVILGALCVYIIIALLFAGIYNFIDSNFPNSFQFNTAPIKSHIERSYNLVYFSFTTLTTVGFGDIVPRSFLAKSFVTIEEITGIFYLAVLVSRLATVMKK